jgi:hypothetical protein
MWGIPVGNSTHESCGELEQHLAYLGGGGGGGGGGGLCRNRRCQFLSSMFVDMPLY